MAPESSASLSWRLNKDFSIDVQGRTTTDSMYDLVAGPKPADVEPTPVPEEILYDTGVPGVVLGTHEALRLRDFVLDEMEVQPDDAGNMNIVSAHEIAMMLFYVDELADRSVGQPRRRHRPGHRSGHGGLHDESGHGARCSGWAITSSSTTRPRVRTLGIGGATSARRSSVPARRETWCPPATSSSRGRRWQTRAWTGLGHRSRRSGRRTLLASGSSSSTARRSLSRVKKGFFRTPGLPARIEAKLPTACVVAAVVGVANNFGYGTFRTFPLGHHSEPFMPGDRTCNGGAYTFQIPGALAVADTVVIPMRVQDSASIRCIYAYVQVPTTDGQSAYRVKVSRDDGATWELLEYMGIAQKLPDGFKNTYDFVLWTTGTASPPRAAYRTTTSASSSSRT